MIAAIENESNAETNDCSGKFVLITARLAVGNIKKPVTMLCEEHTDQNVISFCEDCDTLVCCDCMTDTHERHKFQKLAKVATEKRKRILNEFLIEKENILSDLREQYEELEVSKKESSNCEESIIKDIHDRAEEIKSHVDTTRDKQTSKVRSFFKAQKEALDGKVTSFNEATDKLTNLFDETALQNKSDIEIIQLYSSINKQLEEVRNKGKVSLIEGKFISGGDFEENLEKMFGSFENENETSSDDLDLPRQVNSKSRKLEMVDLGLNGALKHLHMTGEDSGWLLCGSILYFATSISKKSYKEKTKDIQSFTVSKEGDVYFLTRSSVVQRIDKDGKITRWCEMTPYQPQHIFVGKSGEIHVCVWSETKKMHFLCRFDKIGRPLEKRKLPTWVENVLNLAENEFGELCLNYRFMKTRLSTLEVNYLTRYNFCGVLGAKPSESFSIADFCYVSKGRIVALDNTNNVIYLLNRKCSFIKLLTSIDEIKYLRNVTVDRFHRLWIGTSSGTYILSNWDQ